VHAFGNFMDGCSIDRVEGRPVDDMARRIARFYEEQYGGGGWDKLTEADRMSNRRAADHLPVKLRAVGATLVPRGGNVPEFAFTEPELEMLARLEHRRWAAEKLLSGWRPLARTPGNEQQWKERKAELKARKLHIDIVPYDALDAAGQGKDRSQLLGIPGFAEAIGAAVARTAPTQG
jgi:hypothetical protein